MQNSTRILAVLLLTVIGLNSSVVMAESADPLALIFTPPTATTTPAAASTPVVSTAEVTPVTPIPAADLPTVENVVAKASGTSINLTWNAVANADNYTIYFGDKSAKDGGTYATTVLLGNVTTFELKDLTAGMTYYLAVTAENTKEKIGSRFYSTESVVTLDAVSPASVASEETVIPPTASSTEETALPEGMHGAAPHMKKLPQSGPETVIIALFISAGAYFTRKWRK